MYFCSFFIAYDQTDQGLADQKAVLNILVGQQGSLEKITKGFQEAALEVIKRDSYFLSGNKTKNIDIAAVLKMIPIHWVANEIVSDCLSFVYFPPWASYLKHSMHCCILFADSLSILQRLVFPLRQQATLMVIGQMSSFSRCSEKSTSTIPIFLCYIVEAYSILRFIFLESDPSKQLNVEDQAKKNAESILRVIKSNLRAVSGNRVRYLILYM